MKNLVPILAFGLTCSALVSGCGERPSSLSAEGRGGELTASDLALLTDFHAWKVPIPQSQQPVKRIRLVIVKRDGTIIPKFDTGANLGRESCSSILLGFRVEGGTFTGQFRVRDPKGGGQGWGLNFTDAFADSDPHWTLPGAAVWNGNRARLGFASKEGEMNKSELAVELLK